MTDRRSSGSEKPHLGDLFDPNAELVVDERLRPHWSQAGAIVFVTFRTKDSIPRSVQENWNREKNDWLQQRGLLDQGKIWTNVVPKLAPDILNEFKRHFHRCREGFLDRCHGACVLRRPMIAKIVADSLLHFDGERYRMGDFVVMPNHVHLLAAFPAPESMKDQFDSWLHYTAYEINKRLGLKGNFWQQEPFDHLVRSAEQYEYLTRYIAENPQKARLKKGEYLYRRYECR